MDGIPALDLWDVVIEVLHSSKNTHIKQREIAVAKGRSMIKQRETFVALKSEAQIPTAPEEIMVTQMLKNCQLWITLSQMQVLLNSKITCTLLKITKL